MKHTEKRFVKGLKKTAGILQDEQLVENVYRELWEAGFEPYDMAVQADETTLHKKLGPETDIDAENLIDKPNTPTKSPEMSEEYNMKLGIFIGILAYIGSMLSFLSKIKTHEIKDLFIYAIQGAALGILVGTLFVILAYKINQLKLRLQAQRGGVAFWIITPTREKIRTAKRILKKYHAKNIHCTTH
ncbi:MAG: hypothetical protein Tsb005_11990 [Gammaproteobacteria bacterium]